MNILYAIRRTREYYNFHGFQATINKVGARVKKLFESRPSQQVDIIGFYRFLRKPETEVVGLDPPMPVNTINWVIPYFSKGSGGHLNILRFVYMLERNGFDCRIVIVGSHRPDSAKQARKEIREWFFPVNAEVFLEGDAIPAAHVTIATEWRTAYWVRHWAKTRHKCYFVQDFEPWFFPAGSSYSWAEETYRFGFHGITAGDWLQHKLASEYGMRTSSIGFSFDREVYRATSHPVRCPGRRVFFYARPPTERRAFELGVLALDELSRRLPDVEVVFAGWDVSNYIIPFKHENLGLLRLEQLPAVYHGCDAALIISLSNLSLLPLEVMACGTPVVSNDGEWTEWLLNAGNAKLAPATIEGLADAMEEVLNDHDLAQRLRKGGYETCSATDWGVEAEKFATIVRGLDDLD